MKKILITSLALGSLLLGGRVSYGDQLVADIDITDADWTKYGLYWDGDDTNPDTIHPANPTPELAWAKAVTANDTLVTVYKYDAEPTLPYNPGVDWDYVLVKAATQVWLFWDSDGDGYFNTPFTYPDGTTLDLGHDISSTLSDCSSN